MNMIDRVTQAILSKLNVDLDRTDRVGEAARAVIAAMREPTDAMINSIMVMSWGEFNNRSEVIRDYKKMIDAALEEK